MGDVSFQMIDKEEFLFASLCIEDSCIKGFVLMMLPYGTDNQHDRELSTASNMASNSQISVFSLAATVFEPTSYANNLTIKLNEYII